MYQQGERESILLDHGADSNVTDDSGDPTLQHVCNENLMAAKLLAYHAIMDRKKTRILHPTLICNEELMGDSQILIYKEANTHATCIWNKLSR